MRTRLLTGLLGLCLSIGILYSCKKDEPAPLPEERQLVEEARLALKTQAERDFFDFDYLEDNHLGIAPQASVQWRDGENDAFVLSILEEALVQNSVYGYVPDLIQRYGYPAWSRSDVRFDGSNQIQVAFIPFAKVNENRISAYLMAFKPQSEWFFRMVSKEHLQIVLDPQVTELDEEAKEFYTLNHIILDQAMFGHVDSTLQAWILENGDEDTAFTGEEEEIDFRCTEWHIYAGGCVNVYPFQEEDIEYRGPCPPGSEFHGVETIEFSDDCYEGAGWAYFPTSPGPVVWYGSSGGSPGGGAPPQISYNNHPYLMPIMQLCNLIDEVQSGEVANGQTFSQSDIDRCNQIQQLISHTFVDANDLAWVMQNAPDAFVILSNYVGSGDRTPLQLQGVSAYIRLLAQGYTSTPFVEFIRLYQIVFGNLVLNLGLTEEEADDLMQHGDLAFELKSFLNNENNSQDALDVANVLVDMSIENQNLTDEQIIGLVNEFDTFFDDQENNVENLVDYFFEQGLNPLLTSPADAILDNALGNETLYPPGINWQEFTPAKIWELAGPYKTNLMNTYLSQQDKIEHFFPCRVLGTAFENAALNSFGIPANNTIYGGAKPDGVMYNQLIGSNSAPVHQQPVFIEIKGRFSTTNPVFDYSSQMTQLTNYINYLRTDAAYSNTTILHGLYLILPSGISVGTNVIDKATQDNVPLLFSQTEMDPGDGNKVRVKPLDILNLESLNRSGHMFHFLPDSFFRWSLRELFQRKLAYQKAAFNLQYYSQQFENSFLIGNQTPSCPDE